MSRHPMQSSASRRATLRSALGSVLGAAAVGLFCSAANTGEVPEQLAVRYADLDLSSRQDSTILYKRLQRASRHVCREFESRDPSKLRLRQACYDQALTDAVASVNHAVLTALHADETMRFAERSTSVEPRS